MDGQVDGTTTAFILDTGAAVTLLRRDLRDRGKQPQSTLEPWSGPKLVGANGTPIRVLGTATVNLTMAHKTFPTQVVVAEPLTAEAIMGLDFLEKNKCVIQADKRILTFARDGISVPMIRPSAQPHAARISVNLIQSLQIPACSEQEVMAQMEEKICGGTWMIENEQSMNLPVLVARELVSPTDGNVPVRLFNPTNQSVTVYKGARVGHAEIMDDLDSACVSTVSVSETSLTPDIQPPSQTQRSQMQVVAKALNEVVQNCQNLSPVEKEQLYQLLLAYSDIFGTQQSDLGRTDCIRHKIDTGNAAPIRQRTRRLAPHQHQEAKKLVEEMLHKDVIQPSSSPWAAPIVLVRKKHGSRRFCVDYRKINAITRKDAYPIPRVDDALDTLSGSQWFTTLDMISGYWQVEMDPGDREKTAFCTQEGLFEFKVMPFGLCNAPATFQRLMDAVLVGLQWKTCLVYLDDVVIPGRNLFLGLAGYYRRFIKDFATVAKPLHRLSEKTCPFVWSEECQVAFETLRRLLVTCPVLAFPDYTKPFILDTDASEQGIGAVLSQIHDDAKEHVVAYASRLLRKPETKYCVTQRELLAVVEFMKHFRPYLLGRSFTLRSDHGSLIWLQNFKNPDGQLARWLEQLAEYDFTIIHRAGSKHGNADALSRIPCHQCGRDNHFEVVAVATPTGQRREHRDKHTSEMRKLQLSDTVIGPILQAKEKEQKPSPDDVKVQPRSTSRLVQQWDQLEVKGGLLWRVMENGGGNEVRQLIVPQGLRTEVLQELHSGAVGGHLGEEKTLKKLKERFYWPGHANDVKNWCRACPSCSTRKTPAPKQRAPLGSLQAGYPMQIVSVDILGPLPMTETGNSYILVVGDHFTKWMEAYSIPNQEAKTVANKLIDEFFCRYSTPEQLHSDQGAQFQSNLVAEVCRILKIGKSRTTPYHPQCDGVVERFNRTLLDMLATTTGNHPHDWEIHLRKVCLAYNTSVHSTTGYSPFYLMFGHQARLPIDIMCGTTKPSTNTTYGDFASRMQHTLEEAYDTARGRTKAKHERQKEIYNSKCHGKPFETNDLVWLYCPAVPRNKAKKFHHPWTGPWRVIKRLSDAVYRIQRLTGHPKRTVVHFDRLKRCHPHYINETTEQSQHLPQTQTGTPTTQPGQNLQLVDGISDGEDSEVSRTSQQVANPGAATQSAQTGTQSPRYPTRNRRSPDWYATVISH